MSKASEVLVPCKFILLLLQFILIAMVGTVRQEFILQGLPSIVEINSNDYTQAEQSILAACVIFSVMIFLEFFTILFGISLLFERVNVF